MHVIRFSGNERLSERLSWRLFGRLRRKRIGRLKAVREVRKRGFVTFVVQGKNSAALVQPWLTMVRMASYPWLLGSCVIRSMATTSNGWAVGGTLILYGGGMVRCVSALFCWHLVHPLT